MRTLIRDARIFDGTGSAAQPGAVLVEGNRISRVALGSGALADVPADLTIDAAGRTLIILHGLSQDHLME